MKVDRLLKHTFSRDEIVEIAQESASAAYSRNELEAQLDSIKADFKGRIGLLETAIDKAQRKIRDGYEMRDIQCEVQFHTPVDGMKRVVRLDTYEEVGIEAMLPHERQEILPFVSASDSSPADEGEKQEVEKIWPKYDPETGSYDKSQALILGKALGDGDWFNILLLEVDEGSWQSTYEFKVGHFERVNQPITDDYEADQKATCIWSSCNAAVNELRDLLSEKQKKSVRDKIQSAIEVIQAYSVLIQNSAEQEQGESVS